MRLTSFNQSESTSDQSDYSTYNELFWWDWLMAFEFFKKKWQYRFTRSFEVKEWLLISKRFTHLCSLMVPSKAKQRKQEQMVKFFLRSTSFEVNMITLTLMSLLIFLIHSIWHRHNVKSIPKLFPREFDPSGSLTAIRNKWMDSSVSKYVLSTGNIIPSLKEIQTNVIGKDDHLDTQIG